MKKFSRFVHAVYVKKNKFALFHSLLFQTLVVSKEVKNILFGAPNRIIDNCNMTKLLKEAGEDGVQKLIDNHFLFNLDQNWDETIYLEKKKEVVDIQKKAFGLIYLMLTDFCNLRCKYCFIENPMDKKYKRTNMSCETMKRSLMLFASLIKKHCPTVDPQILLYGGEPFLNYHVLKESLFQIRDMRDKKILSEKTTVTINTNGTLIDEERAKFLSQFDNLFISISLDGYTDSQNSSRIYPDGRIITRDVLRNIKILERYGINYGISCTISNSNVDEIEEISKSFKENLATKNIGFNMLIDDSSIYSEKDQEKYARTCSKNMLKSFEYFKKHGIFEDRILRKAKAFTQGSTYFNDCGGCGQQIVVSPDGKIGVCHAFCYSKKFFIPFDEKFNPFTHKYWKEWRLRSPLFMDECQNCVSLGLCGGGCPYNAYKRNQSIWNVDKMFCIHSITTIKYFIKKVAKIAMNTK